ncbi:3-oxoacid CoA-transferase subunit B [Virgibacillus byunsanensis]|uniref:3-oxoacid CoA-transferase subunit B n=1 Tax=Virgibacillus byunsanensis TaxID=570945 RepID=A0ABW3LM36_9BACI
MNIKEHIAKRVSKELHEGDVVNLGIGIPTLVTNFIDTSKIFIHSENGILGVGKSPSKGEIDMNVVNAGKKPVTIVNGASFFDSSFSFSMIRGGHIDVSVLGVIQVSGEGLIANWAMPGKAVLGVGGAMDLLEGSKKIIVATTHTTKDGKPKIVNKLRYPQTSLRKIDMIVTELATFSFDEDGIYLKEIDKNSSLEEVVKKTGVKFRVK